MPIQVQGPDGQIIEFPDGTADAVMERAMREFYGGPDFSNVQGNADTVAADGWQPGFARDVAMGGRSTLQGIGGTLGLVTDPLARMAGLPSAREGFSALADTLNLPRPQTSRERIIGDMGEAIAGTGVTMGVGGLLKGGPIADKVGRFLTAQPGLQAVSAATGAGASASVRERGGGPLEQAGAGLLGGILPGAVSTSAAGLTRGLVRGNKGAQMRRTIDDFASVGANPSVGQASGNRLIQGAENVLGGAPTSAGVIGRFVENQADDIGAGLAKKSEGLFRNASAERAGRAINDGVNKGFIPKTRQIADSLYSRVDEAIPAGTRVDVASTRKALSDLNASIEGAPNVAKFFQNARIQGIEGALDKDTSGIAAVLSRPGVKEQADALRQQLTQQADELEGGYQSALRAWEDEAARLRSVGLNNAPPRPERPQMPNVEAQVSEMLSGMVDNKLPYEALAKLRTLVGNEIDNYSLVDNVPRSKWKALYGALSRDMEAAATTPKAKAAWKRATSYYNARVNRIEALDAVVDKAGGPEKVYRAVMSGTRDGGTTLRSVMQSLDKEGQKAVTAAVIKRMGMATPGAQNAAGDTFSAATFLTNWNSVSKEAKRALFDRYGLGFSQDMDRLARVVDNIKTGSKVFANPSGTANRAAALTYGASLVASLFDASGVSLGGLLAGGASANVAARYLTNPDAVRWLARTTSAPKGAIPGIVSAMNVQAQKSGDQDLAELARLIEEANQDGGGARQ